MKKFYFPLFADTFFFSGGVALLSFCVLRYYDVPLTLSLLVTVLFSLSVALVCFIAFRRKIEKRSLSAREEREKQSLLLHLALEQEDTVRTLLTNAFADAGKTVQMKSNGIQIDEIEYIPRFSMEPLSADVAASLLRANGRKKFGIICNRASTECSALLLSFDVPIIEGDEIYALLKNTNRFPEKTICGIAPKKTIRGNARRFFGKKNARPFFVSGCVLLIMSLFALFPTYYLITGGALIVCAIFVRAFGYA